MFISKVFLLHSNLVFSNMIFPTISQYRKRPSKNVSLEISQRMRSVSILLSLLPLLFIGDLILVISNNVMY